jgi:hypothetical protein
VICDFVPVDGTPVRKAMCCSGFDFKAWRFMLNTLLYSALLHECATARRLSIASSVTDAIWFDVSDELEHEITKYTRVVKDGMKPSQGGRAPHLASIALSLAQYDLFNTIRHTKDHQCLW